MCACIDRQTDRQVHRQTDNQAGRQTNRERHREREREISYFMALACKVSCARLSHPLACNNICGWAFCPGVLIDPACPGERERERESER